MFICNKCKKVFPDLDGYGMRIQYTFGYGSKRDGDLDLGVLREKFGRPEPIVGMLAKAAGLRPTAQPVQLSDLVADFSWDKIPKQDIALPEEILQ